MKKTQLKLKAIYLKQYLVNMHGEKIAEQIMDALAKMREEKK